MCMEDAAQNRIQGRCTGCGGRACCPAASRRAAEGHSSPAPPWKCDHPASSAAPCPCSRKKHRLKQWPKSLGRSSQKHPVCSSLRWRVRLGIGRHPSWFAPCAHVHIFVQVSSRILALACMETASGSGRLVPHGCGCAAPVPATRGRPLHPVRCAAGPCRTPVPDPGSCPGGPAHRATANRPQVRRGDACTVGAALEYSSLALDCCHDAALQHQGGTGA